MPASTRDPATQAYRHTLIIGGTGMLRQASVHLGQRSRILTSVASTAQSLGALSAALRDAACEHHPLRLNWSDRLRFLSGLSDHVARVGPPSLAVLWLHDDALVVEVADALCAGGQTLALFHVRGSAAAHPADGSRSLQAHFDQRPTVRYHQVILGFHLGPRGSRWLDHAEISSGVLSAIEQPERLTVVGSIEPWSSHP